jgi:hypothetical protein
MAQATHLSTFSFCSDDESIAGEFYVEYTLHPADSGWRDDEGQYIDEPTDPSVKDILICELNGEAFDYTDLMGEDEEQFYSKLASECEEITPSYDDY